MKLNVIQQMMLDTGMLEIKLPVTHDIQPENEIAIDRGEGYLVCDHMCSSDCSREGCNCECGEDHIYHG